LLAVLAENPINAIMALLVLPSSRFFFGLGDKRVAKRQFLIDVETVQFKTKRNN